MVDKFGPFDIYDDHFIETKKDTLGNLLLNPNDFDDNLSDIEILVQVFHQSTNSFKKQKIYKVNMTFFTISCQNPFG